MKNQLSLKRILIDGAIFFPEAYTAVLKEFVDMCHFRRRLLDDRDRRSDQHGQLR